MQQLERDLAGDAYEDGDLVFCNELGQPACRTYSQTPSRDTARQPVSPPGACTLRHTAATIALTEGIPLHVVAGRLGEDPRTLLGTYAHLLPHSDGMAAQAVAAVLVDKPLTNEAAAATRCA